MPQIQLDKSVAYGEIAGIHEVEFQGEAVLAKFEQFGHFFDQEGRDLTPNNPVVIPKGKPGSVAEKDSEIAAQKLKIRELERQLAALSGINPEPERQVQTGSGDDPEDPDSDGVVDLDVWDYMLPEDDPKAKKFLWTEVQAEVMSRYGQNPKSKADAKRIIEEGKLKAQG